MGRLRGRGVGMPLTELNKVPFTAFDRVFHGVIKYTALDGILVDGSTRDGPESFDGVASESSALGDYLVDDAGAVVCVFIDKEDAVVVNLFAGGVDVAIVTGIEGDIWYAVVTADKAVVNTMTLVN
ncbi:hypothetical protein NDU88_001713 [Pleurodeles waltl]|uniref:Uncharacterized protein n=1 Tax=Pleurodeles waltl TaxID=8319 RepID=A0AAV7SZY9_PLEWA|nr:hypothetical protein NDU88_001713 [Pleurodeles waltl]